jgi:hypothetical protein
MESTINEDSDISSKCRRSISVKRDISTFQMDSFHNVEDTESSCDGNETFEDFDSDISDLDSKSQVEEMKKSKSLQKFSKLFSSTPTPIIDEEVIRYKKKYQVVEQKEDYGINVNDLKQFKVMNKERSKEIIAQDESLSELALLKTRNYIIFLKKAVKMQSILRMAIPRTKHLRFRRIRRAIKKKFFTGWFQYFKSEYLNMYQHKYKYFYEWRQEARDSKKLSALCSRFFSDCIEKLKLSPQAVMVYFDSKKWETVINRNDLTKFRRLIVLKIFNEWRKEILFLKKTRHQACQFIIRCSRSATNHLYETEAALVCFHMWKRYLLVTKAYLSHEPEPRFTNPYLPQWTRLKTEIALTRIHKTRTAEKGQILSQLRSFKRWRFSMTLDLSAYLSPWEQASIYNYKYLTNWVLQAWITSIKERGSIQRVQYRCFYKWKRWAPLNITHKSAKRKLVKIIKTRRTEQAFQSIVELCLDIIGRRTLALRTLRDNVYNRKLMICVFALMNQDHHVMMIDCWRRWFKWTSARVRWKSTLWQYRYLWHTSKQNAIFCAWRDYVTAGMGKSCGFKSPSKKQDSSSPGKRNRLGSESSLVDSLIEKNNDDDDSRSINTYNTLYSQNSESSFQYKTPESERENVDRLMMKSIKAKKYDVNKFSRPMDSFVENDTSYFNTSFCPVNDNPSNVIDSATVVTYPRMFSCIMSQSLALFEHVQLKGVPVLPDLPAFFFICHCVYLANNKINNQRRASLAAYASGEEMTRLQKESVEEAKHYSNIQQKLQYSIDILNGDDISKSISEGSVVEASHIHQSSKYIGEEFIPMFCILLSCSMLYLTERIVKKDRELEVLSCSDPFKAVILSQHIDRWENGVLSRRELNLIEHKGIDSEVGGDFSGVTLWRSVVLLMLKRRADLLASTCIILPQSRTIDQEVVEVLKRKKITRLRQVRENLRVLLGVEVDPASKLIDTPPQLVMYDDEFNEKRAASIALFKNNQKDVDIYEVLFEYTQMIGKLSKEAKALREPLMERDLNLIRSGFLKQARGDFLKMRKYCMTPKEIEVARLKSIRIKEKNTRIRKTKLLKEKKLEKAREKEAKKLRIKECMEEKKLVKAKEKASAEKGLISKKNTMNILDLKVISEDEANEKKPPGEIDEEGDDEDAKDNEKDESDNDDENSDNNENFQEMQGLTLEEESEIVEEKEFQARTNDTLVNDKKGSRKFIFETWIPRFKKSIIVAQETIKTRILKESNKILSRIHKELFDDINFPDKLTTDKYSGKGGWLIISNIYNEEPYDWKLWLPPAWFIFGNILGKIELEKSIIEATLLVTKSKINNNVNFQKVIENKNSKLSKYLSQSKKSVIETANYKIKKKKEDELNRAGRLRDIQNSERTVTAIKAQAQALADKIKSAELYFSEGFYELVYQIFGKKIQMDFDEGTKFKAVQKSEILIEQNKETLISLMQNISDALVRLRKYNLELLSYDKFCAKSTNWLRSMAQSKFNSMIDVHSIVSRNLSNNKDIKKSSESEEKILNQLTKYNNILLAYSYSLAKENQKSLEDKEVQKFELEKRNNLGSKAYLYDIIKKEQEDANPELTAAKRRQSFRRVSIANILPPWHTNSLKTTSISEDDKGLITTDDNESQSSERISKRICQARKTLIDAFEAPDSDEPTEEELKLMNTKINNKAMQKAIDDELARITEEKLQTAATNALRTRTFDAYWMLSEHVRPKRKKHKAIYIKRDEFGALANEDDEDSSTDDDDDDDDAVILNKTKHMWSQIAKSRLKRQLVIAKRAMIEGGFSEQNSIYTKDTTVVDDEPELPIIPRAIKANDYNSNEAVWKSSATTPALSQGFSKHEHPDHEEGDKRIPNSKKARKSPSNNNNNNRTSRTIGDDESIDDSSTIGSSHIQSSIQGSIGTSVDIFIEAAKNQNLLFKTSSNRILQNITALDYNNDYSWRAKNTHDEEDEDMNDDLTCDVADVLSANSLITKSINSKSIDSVSDSSKQSSISKQSAVLSPTTIQSDLFNDLNSQRSFNNNLFLQTYDENDEYAEDNSIDNSTIITNELSFNNNNNVYNNFNENNEKLEEDEMDSLRGDSDMLKAPLLEPLEPEKNESISIIESMNSKFDEEGNNSVCIESMDTFKPMILKPSEIALLHVSTENTNDSVLSSSSSSSSDDDNEVDDIIAVPFISVLTEEGRKTLNKQRKMSRKNSELQENLQILEALYTKDGKPNAKFDSIKSPVSRVFQNPGANVIKEESIPDLSKNEDDEMNNSILSESKSMAESQFSHMKPTYKVSPEQKDINNSNMNEYGVEHPILLPFVTDIGLVPQLKFTLFQAPGKTKPLIKNVAKDIYDTSGFPTNIDAPISIITLSNPLFNTDNEEVNLDIGKRKKSNNQEKTNLDLLVQGNSDFGRKKSEIALQPVINDTILMPAPGPLDYLSRSKDNQTEPIIKSSSLTVGIIFKKIETPQSAKLVKYIENELFLVKHEKELKTQNLIDSFDPTNDIIDFNQDNSAYDSADENKSYHSNFEQDYKHVPIEKVDDEEKNPQILSESSVFAHSNQKKLQRQNIEDRKRLFLSKFKLIDDNFNNNGICIGEKMSIIGVSRKNNQLDNITTEILNIKNNEFFGNNNSRNKLVEFQDSRIEKMFQKTGYVTGHGIQRKNDDKLTSNNKKSSDINQLVVSINSESLIDITKEDSNLLNEDDIIQLAYAAILGFTPSHSLTTVSTSNNDKYDFFNSNPYNESNLFSFQEGFSESSDLNNKEILLNKSNSNSESNNSDLNDIEFKEKSGKLNNINKRANNMLFPTVTKLSSPTLMSLWDYKQTKIVKNDLNDIEDNNNNNLDSDKNNMPNSASASSVSSNYLFSSFNDTMENEMRELLRKDNEDKKKKENVFNNRYFNSNRLPDRIQSAIESSRSNRVPSPKRIRNLSPMLYTTQNKNSKNGIVLKNLITSESAPDLSKILSEKSLKSDLETKKLNIYNKINRKRPQSSSIALTQVNKQTTHILPRLLTSSISVSVTNSINENSSNNSVTSSIRSSSVNSSR